MMATFLFYDDKIINILLQEEKPSGGAAVQAYGWIKGLQEAGQKVQVLTNPAEAALKEECKDINLVSLYDRHKGIRWLRWAYYRLPYIYKTIKQIKPDYLYEGTPRWQSFLLGIICRRLNIKYILRISNDYLLDTRFFKNYSRLHWFFLKQGIKLSYCVLCQNEYQFSRIKKLFPYNKVIKIANPFFSTNNEKVISIPSKRYIAWLGLYQYQKNLKLLYEIACLLTNESFVIAGKKAVSCDGETNYYLDKLSRLPNVAFAGFLHRCEVLPFLSKAKFLLNTSRYEGFSNTFLEAMSAGTPILTSQNVNPDGIVSQYNLGVVYSDAPDLKKQFLSLTPDTYAAMCDNVLDYVVQQHDYRILSKRLLSYFNSN